MKHRHHLTNPPKVLRRRNNRLDNFSLVSGNLLQEIAIWQQFTDEQPQGTAVMVMPSPTSRLRHVYAAIARVLRENGKRVKLYSAGVPA